MYDSAPIYDQDMFSSAIAENANIRVIDQANIHNIGHNRSRIIPIIICFYMVRESIIPFINDMLSYTKKIFIKKSFGSLPSISSYDSNESIHQIVTMNNDFINTKRHLPETCRGCMCNSKNINDHMDYGGCMYTGLEF